MGLVFSRFGDCVVFCNLDRRRVSLFVVHLDVYVESLKSGKRERVERVMVVGGRYITKGHEDRIAGMIMTLVKLKQLLVAQIRYVARFTPAVIVIGRGREQMFGHHLPENAVR